MRYGTALLLVAAGGILAYAVTWSPTFIDLQTAGQILLLVGVLGIGVSLALDLGPHYARRPRRPPAPPPAREPQLPDPVIRRDPPPADPHDHPTRQVRR